MADAAPTSSEGAAPIDFDFEEFMKDAKTWTADERSEYAEGLEPALFAENSAELSMSPDDVAAMTALQEEGMDNDEIAEHWKNRGNECMKAAAEQKKKGKGGKKKGQKAAAAAAAAAAAGTATQSRNLCRRPCALNTRSSRSASWTSLRLRGANTS